MQVILAGIDSLLQHCSEVRQSPEAYRPERCPHCGRAGLWRHGRYWRKAGRTGAERVLNPVGIPRFYCAGCTATCSVLPRCLAPRRWYRWALQQIALALLLAGASLEAASEAIGACRETVWRWWHWLRERFVSHAAVLRGIDPELGRKPSLAAFWKTCLSRMGLAEAMRQVHRHGVAVP